MTPAERGRFRSRLLAWYSHHRRVLPWRQTDDPYRIWVSEVMLQQTQVRTVIPYYERFCSRFDTVFDLAAADQQDVLKFWEGLGYYARARNLHRAAQRVVADFDGVIPDSPDQFRQLPGVGPYIAAAVQSIAYNRPMAVVDGNVKRVLARVLADLMPVNHSQAHTHYSRHADRLLVRDRPGEYNQALMELGALVCTPRHPQCGPCPVSAICRALGQDKVDAFPQRIKRQPVPRYRIAAGVVRRNGRLLITRRRPEGLLGGLWEFPGGKVAAGESVEKACLREIKEEVDLTVRIDRHLTRVRHAYTHFKIELDVFICDHVHGTVRLNGPVDYRWIRIENIDLYPFPGANRKFIPMLKETLAATAGGTQTRKTP